MRRRRGQNGPSWQEASETVKSNFLCVLGRRQSLCVHAAMQAWQYFPMETNLVPIRTDPKHWSASTDDAHQLLSMCAAVGTVTGKDQESPGGCWRLWRCRLCQNCFAETHAFISFTYFFCAANMLTCILGDSGHRHTVGQVRTLSAREEWRKAMCIIGKVRIVLDLLGNIINQGQSQILNVELVSAQKDLAH